jgi:uncharacterized protein (TIGR02186 family)
MRIKPTLVLAILAGLAILWPGLAGANQPPKLTLTPGQIRIGAFFNGTQLVVSGSVPADDQVVVRLSNKPHHMKFRIKRKLVGLLWMNRGAVSFDNLPSVYLVYTSAKLDRLGRGAGGGSAAVRLGLKRLEAKARISTTSANGRKLLAELVRVKQAEGLYALEEGAVKLGPAKNGRKSFRAVVKLRARIPPGMYKVEAFAFDKAGTMTRAGQKLQVVEVGLPALVSSLAFKHGLIYGILAVLIAVLAGLVMSFLFKKGGGAH